MSASPRVIAKRFLGAADSALTGTNAALHSRNDIINFAIGDPDLNTDPRIIDAAMQAAHAGATHYTDSFGAKELREAIQKFHAETLSHEVSLNEILVTTSATHGLYLTLQAICDPGDEVVVIEPYFSVYTEQIEGVGAIPVIASPKPENGFKLQPEELEAVITPQTRAVIINTPVNPTGVHYDAADLQALGEVIIRHNLLAIADDIYTAFIYDDKFTALATLPGMAERTITVRSFSKDWAMTGWRIGYLLGNAEFINCARDINEGVVYSAPTPSQMAAIAALKHEADIRGSMAEVYRERVFHAWEVINQVPGLSAAKPQGGIYLWVDVSGTGMDGDTFAAHILENAGICVIPGSAFGPCGKNYVRLALTIDTAATDQAVARLRECLKQS